ncbi:MAG TPA: lytic transglycosylase domain-containing protein [Thermoanaerobaculia bacterium]|nr:lytic transglycosylase domain-containing protein [Thermoanaerobaculia bacterium]
MLAFLLAVVAVGVESRIELVALQQEEKRVEAAKLAERLLAESPDEARALGIEYLLGDLRERLGQTREAVAAYARVMRTSRGLRPYALLRAAAIQTELGHPELSSGLLVSLLQGDPPPALIEPAERLLIRSLERGGDCRVLENLALDPLPASTRRRIVLLRLGCTPGTSRDRAHQLLDLLREDGTDLAASEAARRLQRIPGLELHGEAAAVLGSSLHHHREFGAAARHLATATAALPRELESRAEIDTLYLLVRSWFWNGELVRAAAGFGSLAERVHRPEDRARALYHQGRSFELRGEWAAASASYRKAYLADPSGRFSAAGLISALRVEWRTGREEAVLEILDLLPTRPDWRQESARAALYVASSDLVRRRTDRAGRWLRQVELAIGRDSVELQYWRARLEDAKGDAARAVEHYLATLGIDPYHPLAAAASERLRAPELSAEAERAAVALGRSHRMRDLVAALRHLGEEHASGRAAHARLVERAAAHRAVRELAEPIPVPPAAWPIWDAKLSTPEEALLALGVWGAASVAALEHFPPTQPALALTASEGLYHAGRVRRSIYIAEVLAGRIGEHLPEPLWSRPLRVRLHPAPYAEVVERSARARGVEAALLYAVLREESRFDPNAVSPASARGMAQFVFPTARSLASRIGLGRIRPDDLTDPVVSIELAAAYVAELLERFGGSAPAAVAAYNAGDRQVDLWRTHCYSRDPAEFLAKVSFPETRAYVARVLGARARYRELYAPPQQPTGPAGQAGD